MALKAASNEIEVAKGFKVDLIYTVPKGQQGSWVAICVDDKGRLIASDQGNKGLYRIDVSGEEAKVEKLETNITSAGSAHAHGALGEHQRRRAGVHHLTDTDGDNQFDKDEHISRYVPAVSTAPRFGAQPGRQTHLHDRRQHDADAHR